MNAIKLLTICALIIANVSAMAQTKTIQNFDQRVSLAHLIIEKQPTVREIKSLLIPGFTLDSANATGYYITCHDKVQMVAYLYKDTERTVYVGFYENNEDRKEIYEYMDKGLKYIYTASEHMCDYYSKEKSAIRFCPGMKEGLMVSVEKFE
jgi:hypothetical protein